MVHSERGGVRSLPGGEISQGVDRRGFGMDAIGVLASWIPLFVFKSVYEGFLRWVPAMAGHPKGVSQDHYRAAASPSEIRRWKSTG